MPKQTLNINRFEGGLNTDTDPRDLNENEFAELKGAYIDRPGRIRTAGSIAQYNSLELTRNSTPTGYGLFQFGTDYDWEGVYTGREKFTVLTDNHLIKIYDDSWETTDEQGVHADDAGSTASTLQLYSSSMGVDVNNSFYYNNNALRCSFSKGVSSNGESKWIGYINNSYFQGNVNTADSTVGGNIDFTKTGWFIFDQFIAPPIEVFIDNSDETIPDITTFADYNGTVSGTTKATANTHTLLTGDTVTLTSAPDSYYNGTYSITVVDANNFYFTKAYSAEDSGTIVTSGIAGITDCTDSYHWDEIDAANLISVAYAESNGMNTNMSEALKAKWLFGVSYIYDGIDGGQTPGMKGINHQFAQESSIKVLQDDHQGSGAGVYEVLDFSGYTEAAIIQVHFKAGSAYADNTNSQLIGMNARVTGMRFYIKEYEGEGAQSHDKKEPIKPWLRVAEADLCRGNWTNFAYSQSSIRRITSINDTRGNNWNGSANGGAEWMTITPEQTTADTDATTNGIPLFELPSESYYSLNGYKENHIIDCKYSTATVLNHSAYIGDIYDETNERYYGDRVIRTPKFKLDTFSTDFFVDIVPGDGDNIVKLENFADKLMVFKHNKLFIVNVSQESMFIEQELNGMGVAFPGQVAKTDYGITWCNQNGAYIFNGTKVQNLTDNKIKTTWDSFYVETIDTSSEFIGHDYTQVGFDPQSKHIVFRKSNNALDGDCLVYDMKIAGWTYLDSFFTDGEDASNFFTSVDNKLIIHTVEDDYILKYSDASATVLSGEFSIKTKDYDFGNPHVRKKIYKVYITYKCNADTGVKVRFDTNGGTAFDKDFSASTSTKYGSLTLDTTSNIWARAELKPDDSSEANNIYSFALHFISTANVDATFEINDITIIYRTKNVK